MRARRRSSTSARSWSPAASRVCSGSRSRRGTRGTTRSTSTTRPGDGATKVVRYRARNGRALPGSAQEILRVDQPYANHNGGNVDFGPDGKLWVGMGDGGSRRRPGEPRAEPRHAARQDAPARRAPGAARRRRSSRSACATRGASASTARRGDLWIGDVGQGAIEEIDRLPRGTTGLVNFGWDVYEGRQASRDKALGPGRLVQPVAQYTHDDGCSVTGGYVYRGNAVPRLAGPLRLRRLLQRHGLEHPPRRRGAPRRAGPRPGAHVVRREPERRDALRRLRRGNVYRCTVRSRVVRREPGLRRLSPRGAAPAATGRARRRRRR